MPIFVDDETFARERWTRSNHIFEWLDEYVSIDLETTGLSYKYDKIIEIAAVKMKNGFEVECFQSLINPGIEISDFITNLTGITNEMLITAPKISDIFPDFLEFIGESVVVGHNVHFDINFIEYNCWEFRKSNAYFANDYIDTLRLSRRIFIDMVKRNLSQLLKNCNINGNIHHRALSDCINTAKCYEYMKFYALEKNIDIKKINHHKWKAADIKATNKNSDEDNPLFEKECVFTGSLEKMHRKEAVQLVVNLGGKCSDNVTKNTNFLILANSSYGNYRSNKQKKAESYKLKGYDIEIISENTFYELINL